MRATIVWVRRLFVDQRIRYLSVGGTVSGLYLGVFTIVSLLFPGVHYLYVLAIAQVVAISVAFPLYRGFVFKSRGGILGDLARFLSVWVGNLILGAIGLTFLVQVVGLHQIPAQFIAVAAVSVLSFLAHRTFSFRVSV